MRCATPIQTLKLASEPLQLNISLVFSPSKLVGGSFMRSGIVLFLIFLFAQSALGSTPQELSQLLKKSRATQNIIKPPTVILQYQYLTPAVPYDQLFDW